jgi:hypothetical protein
VRQLEIFGRHFVATRAEDGWAVYYPGAEGKRGPRFEIPIPHDIVSPEELLRYLADLCHEWASPRHPDVCWRS